MLDQIQLHTLVLNSNTGSSAQCLLIPKKTGEIQPLISLWFKPVKASFLT